MKKPATASRKRRRRASGKVASHQAAISTTLDRINQIEPQTPKAARVIALLRSWLKDRSGYDENAWPRLKAALDQKRTRRGAERLVDE